MKMRRSQKGCTSHAKISQREASGRVTVACQKRWHQAYASLQNMYPISQIFGKLICIAHHLNLAVQVDALMAATQIVRDKWAVSCQEERRRRWKFCFFLELLSCRQQHAHTPPMLFAGAATYHRAQLFVINLSWECGAVAYVSIRLCDIPFSNCASRTHPNVCFAHLQYQQFNRRHKYWMENFHGKSFLPHWRARPPLASLDL